MPGVVLAGGDFGLLWEGGKAAGSGIASWKYPLGKRPAARRS